MAGGAGRNAAPALLLLLIFLALSPALSEEEPANASLIGVLNAPPKIVEITATASSVGLETVFSVTVFDGNGGYDVCGKNPCNVSCSFAEIFSSQQGGREELSCEGTSCSVFGQFVAKDYSPEWEPKTSRLSAKVPFNQAARTGRWSCTISVSDEEGLSDSRSYSIYLRPASDVSRLVAGYQSLFFSVILPIVTCLVISLQLLKLAARGLAGIDWKDESEKYVQAKAHLDFLQQAVASELSERAATKGRGLFLAGRELFLKGDYSGTMWIAKSAISELGADYRKVHIPRRLLSKGERLGLLTGAIRKRFFSQK